MSNQVTTQNNNNYLAQSAGAASANPYADAGDGAGSSTFMKFVGQSGDFIYGQDDAELAHGTLLVAEISNAKYSWAFWWEGEVLETIEVKVKDMPRAFEQEPDYLPAEYDGDMTLQEIRAERKNKDSQFMDGWSCQGIVTLRAMSEDKEEYTLKLNAGVGMTSFQTLLGAYGRLYKMKGEKKPIIELGARKYKSKIKSVGTRYSPTFKIVEWKSEEEISDGASVGENPDDYDDENVEGPAKLALVKDEPADETPRARGRRGARGSNLG